MLYICLISSYVDGGIDVGVEIDGGGNPLTFRRSSILVGFAVD